jgi:hypothetical protein
MKIAGSHPLGNAARPITGFAGRQTTCPRSEGISGSARAPRRQGGHASVMKEGWGGPHLDDTYDLRIVVRKLRKTIEVDPTRLRILLTELGIGYRLVQ